MPQGHAPPPVLEMSSTPGPRRTLGSYWNRMHQAHIDHSDPTLRGTHRLVPGQFSNTSLQLSGPAFFHSVGPSSPSTSNSSTASRQDDLNTAMSCPWRETGHRHLRYPEEAKPVEVSIPAAKDITDTDLLGVLSDLPPRSGCVLTISQHGIHP